MMSQSNTGAAQFEFLEISRVQESARNPRKHFNQAKLEELADSIQRQGIITPLVVRPANGHYEIAAGHRRYRAATAAGLDTLPCIVRELSDEQFLEVVTIENVQREDVHPLEEAEGYRELLKMPGYDTETLAHKIGKPIAYVYGRLQLCNLAEPARESFLQGAITIGHARLIARLDKTQQGDALCACFARDWAVGRDVLISVAHLKNHIRWHAGRNLEKAPFDLTATDLDAPACIHCPKAAGVNPLLVDPEGDKICLDPGCYEQKVQAHIGQSCKAGLIAISSSHHPKDAPPGALSGAEYEEIYTEPDPDDIQSLEQFRAELAAAEDPELKDELAENIADLEQQIAEQRDCGYSEPAILVHGHGSVGERKRICRNPECPVHGECLKHSLQMARGKDDAEIARQLRENEARKLKEKARIAAREKAAAQVADQLDLDSSETARTFFDILARTLLHHLFSTEKQRSLAALFDIDLPKKSSCTEKNKTLWTAYKKLDAEHKNVFLLRLFLVGEIDSHEYSLRTLDVLAELAQVCEIDLKKLETAQLAELKAAEKAKAAKKAASKKTAKSR